MGLLGAASGSLCCLLNEWKVSSVTRREGMPLTSSGEGGQGHRACC